MSTKKASKSSISSGSKFSSLSTDIFATGGDEVKVIDNYKYHIFTTVGGNSFNLKTGTGKVEVLTIGGGGSGGYRIGGGGGAGSLSLFTSVDVSPGVYTCYVGHGGDSPATGRKNNGGESFFSKNGNKFVLAPGGGGGGSQAYGVGNLGGSGGGGNEWTNSGPTGLGGYAYGPLTRDGGSGFKSPFSGGGGGGSLSTGASSTSSGNGGAGGTGYLLASIDSRLTSSNFSSFAGMTTVCSGGGGGSYVNTGGTGGTGAGNGGNSSSSGSSAVSYGSGGGGGGGDSGGAPAGAGKQGIVIVRYPLTTTTRSSFISSNLVLHLDAANASSYSGSGTLWNDLSGNGNHVTMQNAGSITYTSNNHFSTGSNGYFSRTGSTTLGTGNPSYTMIVWARKPSTWGDSGLITISDSFTTNETNAFRTRSVGGEPLRLGLGSFTNYWWSNDLPYEGFNSANLELNKWFMATTTYNSSTNIRKLFGNNICLIQDTPLGGHNMTNTNLLIGKTAGTEYLAGDISLVLVYNRELSSSEVTEIFNYYKPRFGI
jgi:hypothetical protein